MFTADVNQSPLASLHILEIYTCISCGINAIALQQGRQDQMSQLSSGVTPSLSWIPSGSTEAVIQFLGMQTVTSSKSA